MKKIFSIILATVLLCSTLLFAIPSVSAAKDDEWLAGPDASYIKHGGKTYYPIPDVDGYDFIINYYSDYSSSYLSGETQEITKSLYPYSKVYYPVDEKTWIRVNFSLDYNYSSLYSDAILYVEESCLAEYTALANGKASTYVCANNYDYEFGLKRTSSGLQSFIISPADVEKWKTGESITQKAFMLKNYDCGDLYGFDKTGDVSAICGVFYIDKDTQEVYLRTTSSVITNDDYYVGTEAYIDVTLYKLEDEKLREELIEYFYTEPEDDLEWLEPEEDDMTFGIAFAVFLFGIIPAFVLVFSIAMLFVVKDKRRYSPAYITMIVGSAIVLVSCIILIICLI